jgi:hypothetical protein
MLLLFGSFYYDLIFVYIFNISCVLLYHFYTCMCICLPSAKGDLGANSSGTFTALARLANSLNDDTSTKAPSVLIETNSGSILVKAYDAMTMTVKCASSER